MINIADLPINHRGAVYHLDLTPDELADTVITVGDPSRVQAVTQYFDNIEYERTHREFTTQTGNIGSKRITVVSTGIGMSNIDIVLNELDALINIDLKTRTINPTLKSLKIIRIGTTGALQPDLDPGAVVLSDYALGFDAMMDYYQWQDSKPMHNALLSHMGEAMAPDFHAKASDTLAEQFKSLGVRGITATCSGFYAPQGRVLRLPLKYPQFLNQLQSFRFQDLSVLNLEMETAGLYAMSTLLGHECVSLSLVVANRVKPQFKTDSKAWIDTLIQNVLSILS